VLTGLRKKSLHDRGRQGPAGPPAASRPQALEAAWLRIHASRLIQQPGTEPLSQQRQFGPRPATKACGSQCQRAPAWAEGSSSKRRIGIRLEQRRSNFASSGGWRAASGESASHGEGSRSVPGIDGTAGGCLRQRSSAAGCRSAEAIGRRPSSESAPPTACRINGTCWRVAAPGRSLPPPFLRWGDNVKLAVGPGRGTTAASPSSQLRRVRPPSARSWRSWQHRLRGCSRHAERVASDLGW